MKRAASHQKDKKQTTTMEINDEIGIYMQLWWNDKDST